MKADLPVRLRRLRRNASVRRLFAETTVEMRNLVMPYFVADGRGVKKESAPGSGLWTLTADQLVEECAPLVESGVGGIMLFGVPSTKHDHGHDDKADLEGQLKPLLASTDALKKKWPELVMFADVCLCSYTTHGHCGVVTGNAIDNDATLPILANMSVQLGKAGIDFVSPSDMMDGRVGAIRHALDENGLVDTGILTYAVKMASAFYGPFRDAAHSAPQFGDRKSYQMPAGNRREARREWQLDVAEGADALLVKPAMTNLDVIRDCREECDLPIFAYQVSGERACLVAAAEKGLLDYERGSEEVLLSMRRAGADIIVTYDARERARKLVKA
jgi:porphobilinogen synthase